MTEENNKSYQNKISSITSNPMYYYLFILTIAATVGLQGWRTLFNNYAVEVCDLNGYHIGVIQSFREIPGFLALLVIYILLILKEHVLSAISIVILGAGLFITGFLPSFYGLVLSTLIMSVGFHYFETTNQSLTLQYFNKLETPIVFGRLRSYGALGNVLIGGIIWVLSQYLPYKEIFIIIGTIIMGLGIWALSKDPSNEDIPIQKKKMVFKKKYWLFYILTLLSGARRQIFIVFSVFLMVKIYSFSVQTITIIFVVNNIINYFVLPIIAKWINIYGEKKLLALEYGSLIFIFLAYAFIHSEIIVIVLYIMDHLFFNFSIAIKTYFQKIGDKEDIAPSMAVGFTINHIAAVVIPTFGGLLWLINYKIPFVIGAVFSLGSLLFVFKMKDFSIKTN
ncbi:MAG: MFS transporter [Calditrichia bacterium]|nr:MFS transporter [Calditrichia bacterium]